MDSFSDLLWLLIIFLVITRGLGAARKHKGLPQPPPSTDLPERSTRPVEPAGRRPDRSMDQTRSGPAQRAREAKRSDPVTGFRRRLMEAAREWEAEQRRSAGLPIEDVAEGASRSPEATTEPRASRQRSAWETRDVTPDRVAQQFAKREVSAERASAPPRRSRQPLEPDPEMEAQATAIARPGRSASEPLAPLERFQPLKRAIVLAEILGVPRALSDDPSSKRGAR